MVTASRSRTRPATAQVDAPSLPKQPALLALALIGFSLLTFAPSCANGFVYDDESFVVGNSHVFGGFHPANLLWAITTLDAANWHPATWISLQLDAALFGPQPAGFHLTNVLLHSANAFLIFWLLVRATGRQWPSLAAASLFALHPLHVESVVWITERKDVLSTFFAFLALFQYVRYTEKPGWVRYIALAVAMACSLMAKPMWVTLPVLLLLFDYWPLYRFRTVSAEIAVGTGQIDRHPFAWLVAEKLPLLCLSFFSGALTVYAQREGGASDMVGDFTVRLENAVVSYAAYIVKTIVPTRLAAFYPFPPDMRYPPSQVIAAIVLLVGLTTLTLLFRLTKRYLLMGWLWYLIALLPVAGLVHVLGGHAMADRYTYIPLLGLFVMICWALGDLCCRADARFVACGAGLSLAACVIFTRIQVAYWRDGVSLWAHALDVTKNNHVAHNNMGVEFERAGDNKNAMRQYALALENKSDYAPAHNNVGLLLERRGDLDNAARHFLHAIAAEPANPQPYANLAQIRGQQGNWDEAIRLGTTAVRLDPDFVRAHRNLVTALIQKGQLDQAIVHGQAAVRANRAYAEAFSSLGLAWGLKEEWQQALACHERALALHPGFARFYFEWAHALSKLGKIQPARQAYDRAIQLDAGWLARANQGAWRLATDPAASSRNGTLARYLAEVCCEATQFQNAVFLDTLAAAYAENRQFAQAVTTARQALSLGPMTDPVQDDRLRQRLRLYEANQPFREATGGNSG
jgi:tetratricopeptide (TPR) repeat protein